MRRSPDYLGSEVASQKLANRINAYWAERGRKANARVERLDEEFAQRLRPWIVVSDMVNGYAAADKAGG